jgi:hypothetical protein
MSLKAAAKYFNTTISFLGRTISRASISRILRNHSLRPHLYKYFLQITDPQFFSKMELIIALYLRRPKHLYCFDECPGLQALERLAPSLGLTTGHIHLVEPNHRRLGTTDLYTFLDVNTGKVFGKCAKDHKVNTLIRVFKEQYKSISIPEDEIAYYICDNLSNHSCHEFCRFIAKLCDIKYPEKQLNTKRKRQEWLQSENKKIVIYFTPKHGSWLNMVEIWFGILAKRCLKRNTFESVVQLREIVSQFIDTWNKHFAHPFNWKYKGEGLHEKAVIRFINHLSNENQKMDEKFLSSKIELMIEMLQHYFKYVSISSWQLLARTIEEKKDFLKTIIHNTAKPKMKKKMQCLLSQLFDLLTANNLLQNELAV